MGGCRQRRVQRHYAYCCGQQHSGLGWSRHFNEISRSSGPWRVRVSTAQLVSRRGLTVRGQPRHHLMVCLFSLLTHPALVSLTPVQCQRCAWKTLSSSHHEVEPSRRKGQGIIFVSVNSHNGTPSGGRGRPREATRQQHGQVGETGSCRS